ncbi:hypothetical protein SLEP1_g15005 [Rubroshorea leprosula]|uniref:Thaumatin-like protein n=1 Tax=Rubroshorea leprosula TaxID=152421 RepID=A0AAV5ITU6_9ROSI|nr:hypothetical protein SLEP1_g15005 [Rubroshorea leprosula]
MPEVPDLGHLQDVRGRRSDFDLGLLPPLQVRLWKVHHWRLRWRTKVQRRWRATSVPCGIHNRIRLIFEGLLRCQSGGRLQCSLGVRAVSDSGDCQYAGCTKDLNANCPAELQIVDSDSVVACKRACLAFNTSEYYCGVHSTPQTCPPTQYSSIFKNACPTAYSYAYDDATSTCTCFGSDYLVTFCGQ